MDNKQSESLMQITYDLVPLCIPNIIIRVQLNKQIRNDFITEYIYHVLNTYKVRTVYYSWDKKMFNLYQGDLSLYICDDEYYRYIINPIYDLQTADIEEYCSKCISIGAIFNWRIGVYDVDYNYLDVDKESSPLVYLYTYKKDELVLSARPHPTKDNAYLILDTSKFADDVLDGIKMNHKEQVNDHIRDDQPVIYDTKSTLEILRLSYIGKLSKEYPKHNILINNLIIERIINDLSIIYKKYRYFGFDKKLAELNNKILGLPINEQDYLAPTIEWLKQQLL